MASMAPATPAAATSFAGVVLATLLTCSPVGESFVAAPAGAFPAGRAASRGAVRFGINGGDSIRTGRREVVRQSAYLRSGVAWGAERGSGSDGVRRSVIVRGARRRSTRLAEHPCLQEGPLEDGVWPRRPVDLNATEEWTPTFRRPWEEDPEELWPYGPNGPKLRVNPDRGVDVRDAGCVVPEPVKATEDDALDSVLSEEEVSNEGPRYYGSDGDDGATYTFKAPEPELRFNESYLVFCVDREATGDEQKNFPFHGIRLANNFERMTWARMLTRGLRYDQEQEATIAWDRSILSPGKQKIIGNMMNIRAKSKAAVLRLLEADPYYKKGLYSTVSVYRYPHSIAAEHEWTQSSVPYVALVMDDPSMQQVKNEKFLNRRHFHYLEVNRRVIGYGPLYDGETAWDDASAPQLGHVLFFNAPNDEFATKFVESDPFNLHGVYKSIFTARYNEIDLDGRSLADAAYPGEDPLRDHLVDLGMGELGDIKKPRKWHPFSMLTWLEQENDKKNREEYQEKRRKEYLARDERISWDEGVKNSKFRAGFYVYVGPRNETEWYDYWPYDYQPGNEGWSAVESSWEDAVDFPDVYEDDLV